MHCPDKTGRHPPLFKTTLPSNLSPATQRTTEHLSLHENLAVRGNERPPPGLEYIRPKSSCTKSSRNPATRIRLHSVVAISPHPQGILPRSQHPPRPTRNPRPGLHVNHFGGTKHNPVFRCCSPRKLALFLHLRAGPNRAFPAPKWKTTAPNLEKRLPPIRQNLQHHGPYNRNPPRPRPYRRRDLGGAHSMVERILRCRPSIMERKQRATPLVVLYRNRMIHHYATSGGSGPSGPGNQYLP